MKTIAAVIVSAIALSACQLQEQKVTQVPDLDRVVTVSEFTANEALRRKVVSLCANDPGTLRADPNCINGLQSERLSSSGTVDMLKGPNFTMPPGLADNKK